MGLGGNTFLPDDGFCAISNTTTQHGEEISYTVFYSLAGIYMHAGEASFRNKLEKLNGKTVYHITGTGNSNASYDWIYKVRDRYESFIDTSTMMPLKFLRDVEDGKTKKFEQISFNHAAGTVTTDSGTFKIPSCVQDVLSCIYYSRNINFSKFKKGDKIGFRMFLENEVHELYIRYLGKETVRTKFGKFKAIKFKPLLVEGTIFSGGEKMTVWVSDDSARVPVRIESTILIGSIKVDMTGFKNLRHPLESLERKN
jgi:hypothetical protein